MRFTAISTGLVCLFSTASPAEELPASAIHPVTGNVEVVEAFDEGSSLDVRHIVYENREVTEILADTSADERGPKIEIDGSGNRYVVYWTEGSTDDVWLLFYDAAEEDWETPVLLSGTYEGRRPDTARNGSEVWVTYSTDLTGGYAIVASVWDDNDPFITDPVETTTYTGFPDPLVDAVAGEVWVSWIDSATDIAWIVWDSGTESWSSVSLEDYSQDSVEDARDRIEAAVLGS